MSADVLVWVGSLVPLSSRAPSQYSGHGVHFSAWSTRLSANATGHEIPSVARTPLASSTATKAPALALDRVHLRNDRQRAVLAFELLCEVQDNAKRLQREAGAPLLDHGENERLEWACDACEDVVEVQDLRVIHLESGEGG